jgi:hypothetical protein
VIIAAARARTERRAPGRPRRPREALRPFAARRARQRRGPPSGVEKRKIAHVTRHRKGSDHKSEQWTKKPITSRKKHPNDN